jgi:DNA-binding beta-propeller fold protein YncE
MTATSDDETATLYFTNVLNGDVAHKTTEVDQGTVVRMRLALGDQRMPKMLSSTIIGSGFPEQADPSALVIGPTGVALSSGEEDGNAQGGNTLYVADSLKSRIAAISNASTRTSSAGTGKMVSSGGFLNDPLGLALAPNGHIVTANGNDGLLVETTPGGAQVAHVDTGLGGGSLFGIAVKPGGTGLYLVDDGTNHLDLLS